MEEQIEVNFIPFNRPTVKFILVCLTIFGNNFFISFFFFELKLS